MVSPLFRLIQVPILILPTVGDTNVCGEGGWIVWLVGYGGGEGG